MRLWLITSHSAYGLGPGVPDFEVFAGPPFGEASFFVSEGNYLQVPDVISDMGERPLVFANGPETRGTRELLREEIERLAKPYD